MVPAFHNPRTLPPARLSPIFLRRSWEMTLRGASSRTFWYGVWMEQSALSQMNHISKLVCHNLELDERGFSIYFSMYMVSSEKSLYRL